jgi:hypothetical protein
MAGKKGVIQLKPPPKTHSGTVQFREKSWGWYAGGITNTTAIPERYKGDCQIR